MQVFQSLRQSVGPGCSGGEKKRLEAHDRVMRRGSTPTADGDGGGILAARRGTGRGGQDVASYRESTGKLKIQEKVRACADVRERGTCGARPERALQYQIRKDCPTEYAVVETGKAGIKVRSATRSLEKTGKIPKYPSVSGHHVCT